MIQRWESPIKLSESNRWSCGTSALYTSAWDCFDLDNLFFDLPVQMSPDVNYPRHPVTFTFYDITSQHGDFDSLWNCLCQQSSVSISVAKWVKLRTTKPQVKSSNITGTFVFMKSNIFLKVDFPPPNRTIFSAIFKTNAYIYDKDFNSSFVSSETDSVSNSSLSSLHFAWRYRLEFVLCFFCSTSCIFWCSLCHWNDFFFNFFFWMLLYCGH